MERKIIKIDQDLCVGCGLCVSACMEGAIALVDGKAQLTRDDYCDGLGNCLPVCPTKAITFEVRKAAPFDKEAALQHLASKNAPKQGCPGSRETVVTPPQPEINHQDPQGSRLQNFPVQLQLVSVNAAFFEGARLLLAADCAAYASGSFHQDFMKNHVTLIGCPKLDEADYTTKLTDILNQNDIKSLTIVRMEVPCCGGIERIAKKALKDCDKLIPWKVVTLSVKGEVVHQSI